MSIWRRAYLHIVRKKGKTVLIFLVLFITSTLILTGLAIRSSTNLAALNTRQAFMGGFTINATHMEQLLEDSTLEEILKEEGLLSKYNLRSYYYGEYQNLNGEKLETNTQDASVNERYVHAGKVISNSQSDLDSHFTKGNFKLLEGRHILADDVHVVLVSDDFAKRNHLSLHDEIYLGDVQSDSQIKVRIIGIFESPPQDDLKYLPSSEDLYNNTCFTDNKTCSQLQFDTGSTHYQYGDFYVNDPAELDDIITKIKEIDGVNWDNAVFTKNDVDYQNAKGALESLQQLVMIIIIILIVITIVLVTLILILWMRERMHEIGILLSMGVGKANIMIQHIMEMLIIAILAFSLSYLTSSFIVQNIGDNLLQQTTDNRGIEENISEDLEKENSDLTDFIRIEVSTMDLVLLYSLGSAIILLSIIIASYPMMRLKPKEILTKMS